MRDTRTEEGRRTQILVSNVELIVVCIKTKIEISVRKPIFVLNG